MQKFEQPGSAKDSNPFRSHVRLRSLSRGKFGDELVDEIEAQLRKPPPPRTEAGVYPVPLWSPEMEGSTPKRFLDTENPPIIAGKGGEHLVFEVPAKNNPDRSRGVVVKVNVAQTLDQLSYDDLLDEKKTEEGISSMGEAMIEREERLEQLRKFFGRDAVPAHRFFIEDVPVTRELVQSIRPSWLPDEKPLPFEKMPAWIDVQQRVDLDPEKTVSLNGTYLEQEEYGPFRKLEVHEAKKIYALSHEVLAGLTDLPAKKQREVALRAYPNLKGVAERVQDPEFAAALGDLVKKLIAYAEETDDAMDLMGRNNLVMTKTPKGWRPKLLDVLHLDDFTFEDFGLAVHAAKSAKRVDSSVASGVYNAMNTVRVINALAIIAGMEDRLRIDELDEASAAGWKEIITERKLSSAQAA